MPQTDHVTASRLTDYRVQDHASRSLGYVADVVVNLANGHISHVIVVTEKNLFAVNKQLLVPWGDFVKAYNDQVLTLDTTHNSLQAYPEAPFDLRHRGLLAGAPEGNGASASFSL